jgi:hypothetical protein
VLLEKMRLARSCDYITRGSVDFGYIYMRRFRCPVHYFIFGRLTEFVEFDVQENIYVLLHQTSSIYIVEIPD